MPTSKIRLLGISGSKRAGGNTDQALGYAARVAAEYDAELSITYLRDHHIEPCGSCGNCNDRTSPCGRRDDVPQIVEAMTDADGIIYAVPVHGFGMAHLMQIFIERAGVGFLRFRRPLANKVGGVVVIGRRYAHSHVHAQLVSNLLLNRMILIGSGFPPSLFAGGSGEVWDDTEGLAALQCMVTRMIDMARLIKGYTQVTQGLALPPFEENERQIRPSFASPGAVATLS